MSTTRNAGHSGAATATQVQHPLTMIMPIKPAPAADQLEGLLEAAEPQVVAALKELATVHFARFVFLENKTKLALITTYDGDFEVYVRDFVAEIGDFFNAALEHVADAPPLPVEKHDRQFLQYIIAHNPEPIIPMFSAYPTKTVLDIEPAT